MLEELIEELTKKFLLLNNECECEKVKISLEVAKNQLEESRYNSEAARFVMQQAEDLMKGQQRMTAQVGNITRPSVSMAVDVTYDGNDWFCENGDVRGVGVTPETACQDFDRLWLGRDEV